MPTQKPIEDNGNSTLKLKNCGTNRDIITVFVRQFNAYYTAPKNTPTSTIDEPDVNVIFYTGRWYDLKHTLRNKNLKIPLAACDPDKYEMIWYTSASEAILNQFEDSWNNQLNGASQPIEANMTRSFRSRPLLLIDQQFGQAKRFFLSSGTSNDKSGSNFPDTYLPFQEAAFNIETQVKVGECGYVPKVTFPPLPIYATFGTNRNRKLYFRAHRKFHKGETLRVSPYSRNNNHDNLGLTNVKIVKDIPANTEWFFCTVKSLYPNNAYKSMGGKFKKWFELEIETMNSDYFVPETIGHKVLMYANSTRFSIDCSDKEPDKEPDRLRDSEVYFFDPNTSTSSDIQDITWLLRVRHDFLERFASWQDVQISCVMSGSFWDGEGGDDKDVHGLQTLKEKALNNDWSVNKMCLIRRTVALQIIPRKPVLNFTEAMIKTLYLGC